MQNPNGWLVWPRFKSTTLLRRTRVPAPDPHTPPPTRPEARKRPKIVLVLVAEKPFFPPYGAETQFSARATRKDAKVKTKEKGIAAKKHKRRKKVKGIKSEALRLSAQASLWSLGMH